MAIDFGQVILGIDGEPLTEGEGDDEKPLVLRAVCARALSMLMRDESDLNLDEKLHRGQLAIKIFDAEGPLALKADEITLTKKMVGKVWGPIVVARAIPMLDPAEIEAGD